MAERRPVTASTKIAAVIGHPVEHSLSPVIHNAAFADSGLDWVYAAFDVAPGSAGAAVQAMRALHLAGLSVTMPHKDDVAAAVDRMSPQAARLGTVNTVVWEDDELVGHSTDGAGLVDSLIAETGGSIAGSRCLVLGAGGAARSICLALGDAGAADVAVVNRTPERAVAAAELAGEAGRVVAPGDLEAISAADIVLNATSVGMAGTEAARQLPLDPAALVAGQIVVDLVYHPVETPLLAAALARGAQPVTGVGMLVHQAAHQFTLWTAEPAPVDAMRRAVADVLVLW